MSIILQDTFAGRTVSGSWGTGSDGNAWTQAYNPGGATPTYGVGSGEGFIKAGGGGEYQTYGTATTADGEGLVRFKLGTTTDNVGIILRWTDATHHYFAYTFSTTQVRIAKRNGSSSTTTIGVVTATGLTLSTSNYYWLRFRVQGTTLEWKLWQDGTSEPTSWTYSTTDSSLASAGKGGLYTYSNSSSAQVNVDSFTVDNLVNTGATFTGKGGLSVSGTQVLTGAATFKGHGSLNPSGYEVYASQGATFPGHGKLLATGVAVLSETATFTGKGGLSVSGHAVITAGATFTGRGRLIVTSSSATNGAATFTGQGKLLASGYEVLSEAATFTGKGGLSVAGYEVVTGGAIFHGQGKLLASGNEVISGHAATFTGKGGLSVAGHEVVTGGATFTGHGYVQFASYTPGTGIGDVAQSSHPVSWPNSTNGAGSGTETRITYKDATGSGYSYGLWPHYGGAPITALYEEDANTTSANQTSDGTTASDGHIHWLEQSSGGVFSGSEDVLFDNAGGLTELAPAGTPFRYYAKVVANTVDANGFQWTMWCCVYPGDPGFVFYRFDCQNPSGSPKSLLSSDSLEIALLGGLQQADSTWAATNGGYGQIAGADHVGWPSALTSIEPDYVYITPNQAAAGVKLGQATIKKTSLTGLGWSSLQMQYLQSSGANGRLKVKVQGNKTSFPANSTETVYLLGVLRRNLSASDVRAMAADYLNPGAPTVTNGTYTGWSDDEGLYVFANSGAASPINITLDMTPSAVSVRYKPRYKITNWTDTNTPLLTWGGAALVAGVDFRWTRDAGTNTLYLQLYSDVVASGANLGQRVNATLAVSPAVLTGAATWRGQGKLVATGVQTLSGGATFVGQGRIQVSDLLIDKGRATFPGQGGLSVSGVQVVSAGVSFTGHGLVSLSGHEVVSEAATFPGHGTLNASGYVVAHGAATFHGQGALMVGGFEAGHGNAVFHGQGALVVGGHAVITAGASFQGHGSLHVAGQVTVTAGATLPGHGGLHVAGVQVLTGGATFHSQGGLALAGVQVVSGGAIFRGLGRPVLFNATAHYASAFFNFRGALVASGGVPGWTLAITHGPGAAGEATTNDAPHLVGAASGAARITTTQDS